MQASCLDDPQPIGYGEGKRDDRIIEILLKHRLNMDFEASVFGEVAGFLQELRFQLDCRLVDGAEHALDRLNERYGRIFHPRRQVEPAAPSLVDPFAQWSPENNRSQQRDGGDHGQQHSQGWRGDACELLPHHRRQRQSPFREKVAGD